MIKNKLSYEEYLDIENDLLNIVIYDNETLKELNLEILSLNILKKGCFYVGDCRNSDIALWDGNKFNYIRSGWTLHDIYIENLNHLENETHECVDTFQAFAMLEYMDEEIQKIFLDSGFEINKIYKKEIK